MVVVSVCIVCLAVSSNQMSIDHGPTARSSNSKSVNISSKFSIPELGGALPVGLRDVARRPGALLPPPNGPAVSGQF